MKYCVVIIVVVIVAVILALTANTNNGQDDETCIVDDHTYVTTLPMEFDKCCAMWLIRRFYDVEAEFEIHPQGTYVTGPRAFDVSTAVWSRQHRKCTSDCIWEELGIEDAAARQIVEMAHHIELNHWARDSFPRALQCNGELLNVVSLNPDIDDCVDQAIFYFDRLHEKLKAE